MEIDQLQGGHTDKFYVKKKKTTKRKEKMVVYEKVNGLIRLIMQYTSYCWNYYLYMHKFARPVHSAVKEKVTMVTTFYSQNIWSDSSATYFFSVTEEY